MPRGFSASALRLAAAVAVAWLAAACTASFEFDSGGDDEAVVIVRPPQSTTVVAGEAVRFSIGVTAGDGEVSYRWQRNGVPIEGANGAALELPATATEDDGSLITVTVCDERACQTSLPALLSVLRGS